jgi:hypothetical protein
MWCILKKNTIADIIRHKLLFLYYYYVGICVTTKQIRVFSFSVSGAPRYSPSARCVIAVNDMCRFLVILSKNNFSLEGVFFIAENF